MSVSIFRSRQLLFLAAILILAACAKTPTTAQPDDPGPGQTPAQPTLSIACSPSSGSKDTEVTVTVSVKENANEIGVFGMDLTFPPRMLEFVRVNKGALTGDWAAVDGNEVSSGNLKIGGFKGSAASVAKNSAGSLVVIKFKVDGSRLSSSQQGQICIKSYTDDITGIPPEPACASFQFTK
jgi:hypothetical protein